MNCEASRAASAGTTASGDYTTNGSGVRTVEALRHGLDDAPLGLQAQGKVGEVARTQCVRGAGMFRDLHLTRENLHEFVPGEFPAESAGSTLPEPRRKQFVGRLQEDAAGRPGLAFQNPLGLDGHVGERPGMGGGPLQCEYIHRVDLEQESGRETPGQRGR